MVPDGIGDFLRDRDRFEGISRRSEDISRQLRSSGLATHSDWIPSDCFLPLAERPLASVRKYRGGLLVGAFESWATGAILRSRDG